eukprot:6197143-Pleurochrysis_carterae.AAC.3
MKAVGSKGFARVPSRSFFAKSADSACSTRAMRQWVRLVLAAGTVSEFDHKQNAAFPPSWKN